MQRVAEACSSMRMSELDRLAHNFEWKDPATQRDEVGCRAGGMQQWVLEHETTQVAAAAAAATARATDCQPVPLEFQ
jgi:hypothetical protein